MLFIDAMLDWTRKKDHFVSERLKEAKSKRSPRKNIMLTVPLEFEEDIKAYAKAKRQESDSKLVDSNEKDKLFLSLEFEAANPPPKASDF